MTKKHTSWTYENVIQFLAGNDFSFSEPFNGSFETWVKLLPNGEPDRFIEIPFTGHFYSEKQLKKMIKQSNIPEKNWNQWLPVSAS